MACMAFREYCGDLTSSEEDEAMELLNSSGQQRPPAAPAPHQHEQLPFYALPRAKKTSAEIIHEARAALGDGRAVVRTVDTTRPFTPRDRQRTLFGSAQSSASSGRPSSAFSMNSLSFDSGDSRPMSNVRLVPLTTRAFCHSGSPHHRQRPRGRGDAHDAVCLPSLPGSAGSRASSGSQLPVLTMSYERMNRRQFRAASLDKLCEEAEEPSAATAAALVRNAHSGPRERPPPSAAALHQLTDAPRPPASLPHLAAPASVPRRIVEALQPAPEPPAPRRDDPSSLDLVMAQPEDAGDLCVSDLESSQRLTREFAAAAAAARRKSSLQLQGAAPDDVGDDFGWAVIRRPQQPLPAAGEAAGAGGLLRRPVVVGRGRRGRSNSPRKQQKPQRRLSSSSSSSGDDDQQQNQQRKITALLARLSSMADSGAADGDVLVTVEDLYQLLSESGQLGRSSPHRIAVLKAMFRFVDRQGAPRLLLHISRTILALQVSGKNLVSVCKLVFKVAQDDNNDTIFFEANILEHLLNTVGRSSPLEDGEACVFSYGALKFLTMNSALVARLMDLGILDLVVLHMKMVTAQRLEGGGTVSEHTGHALYQLTGLLRNLANVERSLPQLVQSGAVEQVCHALAAFTPDMDVISNVARILSIVSAHDACCERLVSGSLSWGACVRALNKFPGAAAIVVRLGYALGNMMARSEPARLQFFREPGSLDCLLRLLEQYSCQTSGGGRQTQPSPRHAASSDGLGERGDAAADDSGALTGTPEDVMVKLVRVVANMVINQEVGAEVAGSAACLRVLLNILRTHSVEDHEELVSSSLSMLNNLTFYAGEDSVLFERQQEVTHCLCGLLRQDHTECQIEVLRVFGNLTRWPAVREALGERQAVSLLCSLLDSDNRELVYTTAGVLINLMTDPAIRLTLTACGGVDRLVAVLEDFGYSDWQLAALVCKVLWNLAADEESVTAVLTEQQADQLAVVLDEYLDDEVLFPESGLTTEERHIAAMLRPLWEEFADVASSLLDKLDATLENASTAAAPATGAAVADSAAAAV